jgi:hypothetical protein
MESRSPGTRISDTPKIPLTAALRMKSSLVVSSLHPKAYVAASGPGAIA